MKVLLLFLVLGASVTFAMGHSRGCVYDFRGQCRYECDEGTHAYLSSCGGVTWSKRTCREPVARDMGPICDLSRCDCDEPTVLDENNGKCVKVEECTKQEPLPQDVLPAASDTNSTDAETDYDYDYDMETSTNYTGILLLG